MNSTVLLAARYTDLLLSFPWYASPLRSNRDSIEFPLVLFSLSISHTIQKKKKLLLFSNLSLSPRLIETMSLKTLYLSDHNSYFLLLLGPRVCFQTSWIEACPGCCDCCCCCCCCCWPMVWIAVAWIGAVWMTNGWLWGPRNKKRFHAKWGLTITIKILEWQQGAMRLHQM